MAQRDSGYEKQPRNFYSTPAWVTHALVRVVKFSNVVWEPASGAGDMARALAAPGRQVLRSDIRPVADPSAKVMDFLTEPCPWPISADIVTNPPYGRRNATAVKFIERSIEYARPRGTKIAMLLSVDFDSASGRQHLFRDCPAFAGQIVLLNRIVWFGDGKSGRGPSANHAWFLWDWSTPQVPRKFYA